MRKIILLFFFLMMPALASKVEIEVLKVYDGDTILARIEKSNSIFRIRLIDIDCFEGTYGDRAKYQAKKYNLSEDEIVKGGNLAGDFLRNELKDNKIYFEFMGIDKYHRALGTLYSKNININKKMLQNPYCKPYSY